MIWVPVSTMEQDGALLRLPYRVQYRCHHGYNQLLKGVQAPTAAPWDSQMESLACVLCCSWAPTSPPDQ